LQLAQRDAGDFLDLIRGELGWNWLDGWFHSFLTLFQSIELVLTLRQVMF
jgi:hypothetical protein